MIVHEAKADVVDRPLMSLDDGVKGGSIAAQTRGDERLIVALRLNHSHRPFGGGGKPPTTRLPSSSVASQQPSTPCLVRPPGSGKVELPFPREMLMISSRLRRRFAVVPRSRHHGPAVERCHRVGVSKQLSHLGGLRLHQPTGNQAGAKQSRHLVVSTASMVKAGT